MSNTNVSHQARRSKSTKYQPVVLTVNPNSSYGREQARDLIRAHFRFVINNLDFKAHRKYAKQLVAMNMWLVEDEMLLTEPAMAKACNVSLKNLNCDLSQIGRVSFAISKSRVMVKVDRSKYYERIALAQAKERRLFIAADLLRVSADLTEAA